MVFCSYRNRLEPKIENRFAGDWLKKAGNVQINLEIPPVGWMATEYNAAWWNFFVATLRRNKIRGVIVL